MKERKIMPECFGCLHLLDPYTGYCNLFREYVPKCKKKKVYDDVRLAARGEFTGFGIPSFMAIQCCLLTCSSIISSITDDNIRKSLHHQLMIISALAQRRINAFLDVTGRKPREPYDGRCEGCNYLRNNQTEHCMLSYNPFPNCPYKKIEEQ